MLGTRLPAAVLARIAPIIFELSATCSLGDHDAARQMRFFAAHSMLSALIDGIQVSGIGCCKGRGKKAT